MGSVDRFADWVDGPLVGFDLETTGADPFGAVPVSFAFVAYDGQTCQVALEQLVDPGIPIPPDSTAIHHVTDEMVRRDGVGLDLALEVILDVLLTLDAAAVPVVGMNVSYDLTIIDRLACQHDGHGLADRGWCGPVIDVSVLDRQLDKWRKGARKLVDLCSTYGVVLEHAHDARSDTTATVEVLLAMVRRYPELGDCDLRALTDDQRRWKAAWLEDFNAYRAGKGLPAIPAIEGRWPVMS